MTAVALDISGAANPGWVPELIPEQVGSRVFWKVNAWKGGVGTPPTYGVGLYIGSTGFVARDSAFNFNILQDNSIGTDFLTPALRAAISQNASIHHLGATAPTQPFTGMMWLDSTDAGQIVLKIYNNNAWQNVWAETEIDDGSIVNAMLGARAVRSVNIALQNITNDLIEDGTIQDAKIAALATSKLTGVLDLARIPTLDNTKIPLLDLAKIPVLTNAKVPLLDLAKIPVLTNAKIPLLEAGKIPDNSIGTPKLINKAVTAAKMNSGNATAGQVPTADGNSNVTYQDAADILPADAVICHLVNSNMTVPSDWKVGHLVLNTNQSGTVTLTRGSGTASVQRGRFGIISALTTNTITITYIGLHPQNLRFNTSKAGYMLVVDGGGYINSTQRISTGNLATGTATADYVPVAQSDGTIAWQAQSGSNVQPGVRMRQVTASITAAPDDWAVGQWVYNARSGTARVTRGTAPVVTIPAKSIRVITAFGTNLLTLSDLLMFGKDMLSAAGVNQGEILRAGSSGNWVAADSLTTHLLKTQSTAVPDDWTVGDWVYNQSTTARTLTRGTGTTYVYEGYYPITAIAENSVSLGSEIKFSRYTIHGYSSDQGKFMKFGVGNKPDIVTANIAVGDLPSGIPINKIATSGGVLNPAVIPNLPVNPETITDCNDKWEDTGIYRFNAYTNNSPLVEAPGYLFAEHNDQTALVTGNRLDGSASTSTAGRIYSRSRDYTVGGLTGVSDIANGNLGFTLLSNSNNFNDLPNGFAYWFGSVNQNTNTRPTNAPPWGAFAKSRVGTILTTDAGQVALVGGGSGADNLIRLWVRLRSGNSWDQSGSENGWYVSTTDVNARLPRIGAKVVTSLHQLRVTSNTDFHLWIPSAETGYHPRTNTDDVSSSGAPIWVSRYLYTGVSTIRFVWNHGGTTGALNAVQLAVRTSDASFTIGSPTAWELIDDNSVTGASFASGTLTLTKADASTVTASGFPQITFS